LQQQQQQQRYEQPTLPIITYTGGKGAQKAVVYILDSNLF
jgi:hypothetical protein